MQTWLIFSLLSVAALAGSEISQKISLTQKVNISAITNNFFVWTIQATIGILLAIIFGQFSISLPYSILWKLFLIGIVYFAGGTLFYTSYKGNSPSISIVLGTISVVFSSLLGKFFLHDIYTMAMVGGIILILSSIAFININLKEKLNKYNLYAILGGMCFGMAFTIDKYVVTTISPFMYLGLMCLSVALVSLITSYKRISTESSSLKPNNFIPMISSASFGATFNLFTFFAYKNGANVGVADAINNSTVFLVILLEIILLKDHKNLFKKILAASLATAGVILIGIK
ncbi:MAG: EamA family transporter [bacterium]